MAHQTQISLLRLAVQICFWNASLLLPCSPTEIKKATPRRRVWERAKRFFFCASYIYKIKVTFSGCVVRAYYAVRVKGASFDIFSLLFFSPYVRISNNRLSKFSFGFIQDEAKGHSAVVECRTTPFYYNESWRTNMFLQKKKKNLVYYFNHLLIFNSLPLLFDRV